MVGKCKLNNIFNFNLKFKTLQYNNTDFTNYSKTVVLGYRENATFI